MTVTFKKQAAQGDMLIRTIDKLPANVKEIKAEGGKYILAHSETGHHHVVRKQDGITFYSNDNDPFIAYLVVDNTVKKALIEHERSFDTHETIALKCPDKTISKENKRVYEIRRQREYMPDGFRKAQD